MYKIIIPVAAAIIFFVSCRSAKNIQTAIAKKDTVAVKPVVTATGHEDTVRMIQETYAGLLQQKINYKTFSAKIDVDYQDADGKKYNVTAHLRINRDSVIWVSITAILGIEGLRAYITRDSVKLLDKQNKIYTARSVSYLQDVSDLPLNLSSLQDLLVGNPVFLDTNIVSYSKSNGAISLLSSGIFFKNLLTVSETNRLMQSSKLDDADELRNRTCYLTYDNYEDAGQTFFSSKRSISVTEKKKLDIQMNFKQHNFNETLSFPFSVPKNYKRN